MDNHKDTIVSVENISSDDRKERIRARVDMMKIMFDLFKHLTTINSASLILLVAFLKELFPHPIHREFVYIAFISLILSLAASLVCMYLLISAPAFQFTNKNDPMTRRIVMTMSWLGFIAMGSYFSAAIFLSAFFITNYRVQ